jgi:hypothetical protein
MPPALRLLGVRPMPEMMMLAVFRARL